MDSVLGPDSRCMTADIAAQNRDLAARLRLEGRTLMKLRAEESRLRWDVDREERAHNREEDQAEPLRVMQDQAMEIASMQTYVMAKAHAQAKIDIAESKEHQEFKRDWKRMLRERNVELTQAELFEDTQQAMWEAHLREARATEDHEFLADRCDCVQELRQICVEERQREKEREDDDRAQDIHLETLHQVKQTYAKQATVLRSMEVLRAARRTSPRSVVSLGLNGGALDGKTPRPRRPLHPAV